MNDNLKSQTAISRSTLRTEDISERIHVIRGQRVMLDADLAELYGVSTKRMNEAVRRNATRFPEDFMFQLSREEDVSLRSQIATLKVGRGQHRKFLPYAFTEQGVAMLSGVLHSPRAIQVNVAIMRVFVRMRRMLVSHEELARKVDSLEKQYDEKFRMVFDAIRALMEPPKTPRRRIGF
ncbi:MAG: ORF6N domain-containing protein [Deltaproteobacteria bacterium]